MSADLTTRLRTYAAKYGPLDPEHQMCMEAAEEIEGLRDCRQHFKLSARGWREAYEKLAAKQDGVPRCACCGRPAIGRCGLDIRRDEQGVDR